MMSKSRWSLLSFLLLSSCDGVFASSWKKKLPTTKKSLSSLQLVHTLPRGGGGDNVAVETSAADLEMASNAFGWCANLGAPSALVAGAVWSTLNDDRTDLAPKSNESWLRRHVKLSVRILLLSAFALEIIAIFSTTVVGTMLMTQGDVPTGSAGGVEYHSPMGFLHVNHEFEYLTARVCFLQGLLHWLIAAALELTIPKEREGHAARCMNQFISSSLITLTFFMISFYNAHMSFYGNYLVMLKRFFSLAFHRYVGQWKQRPMSMLYIPSILYTLYLGWKAMTTSPSDWNDELAKTLKKATTAATRK